jgi:hypothetical protein
VAEARLSPGTPLPLLSVHLSKSIIRATAAAAEGLEALPPARKERLWPLMSEHIPEPLFHKYATRLAQREAIHSSPRPDRHSTPLPSLSPVLTAHSPHHSPPTPQGVQVSLRSLPNHPTHQPTRSVLHSHPVLVLPASPHAYLLLPQVPYLPHSSLSHDTCRPRPPPRPSLVLPEVSHLGFSRLPHGVPGGAQLGRLHP